MMEISKLLDPTKFGIWARTRATASFNLSESFDFSDRAPFDSIPSMADWRSPEYLTTLRKLIVEQHELDFFNSYEWTHKLLNNPSYTAVTTSSRTPKSSPEDDFFAKTLRSSSTISNWLLLIRSAFFTSDGPLPSTDQPDALVLLNLGRGVNGFTNTAHGGLLCAVLDEALSMCVEVCRHNQTTSRNNLYTARLEFDFRRPVLTPGIVLLKCWLQSVEGRKWRVRGQILDSSGGVCVEAAGLWVEARDPML